MARVKRSEADRKKLPSWMLGDTRGREAEVDAWCRANKVDLLYVIRFRGWLQTGGTRQLTRGEAAEFARWDVVDG